ncbi:D-alanyl-D-alanine carboxypeptidase/D-alanyl-D-alanine-endopeptidase [Candidatus Spongiihabitans sp.]|uniref:D-alanyl-D-alanine carboxypeptidase/D-alanyl-D-alanine-endopeptidase n=1 Tax=Candidatus Spongiihabitans sp. TaxID=3101308 RepID=UPI003C79A1CE
MLLKKHGIPLSAVSLDIQATESQHTLVSLNSNAPRNPASVIKLVTTLAALEILGPAYQWHTRYFADGAISNGVLNGDLVLQGGGDPFLTVDKFLHHVLSLRQRGIHTITGSLVIDNSLFDVANHDRARFDGQPSRLYNVEPDAALVNFSATRFIIQPMQTNGETRIAVFADPPLSGLVVENNMKPQPGKCPKRNRGRNRGWSYELHKTGDQVIARFNGKYRSRCGQHAIARSLFSNHEYTYRLFKYLWRMSGGAFDGGYKITTARDGGSANNVGNNYLPTARDGGSANNVGNNYLPTARDDAMDGGGRATHATKDGGGRATQEAKAEEAKAEGGSADFAGAKNRPTDHAIAILSYPSEPLADIIASINKYSNNVMARQLLLSLDAHRQQAQGQNQPATVAGGIAAINNWLSENVGIMPELIIDNGAGLSRKTRITTANLTALLQQGWRSNYRAEFLSSFSLAALDGTMKKRLRMSALPPGRARIKTGLINRVRSMAGFVNARDNKHYSVAMMIESKNVSFGNGNVIQDAVLEWIYNR